jgi:phage repressor protein C with HTH and peptisase S24 domain
MNVKERLKKFIKFSEMTVSGFEKSISVTNGYVNSISKSIGIDKIEKIIEIYPNLNIEWMLAGIEPMIKRRAYFENDKTIDTIYADEPRPTGFRLKTDNDHEAQLIPLYDIQASAGIVSLFNDLSVEKPIDHISIPNLPKCDGAIYVSGDSMYPLLKSGDVIMYKKVNNSIDNIFWGEMYLVSIINEENDEFVMVKWIHKSDKGEEWIKLVSENRHHQPKDMHLKNVKGLALIKASIRINSMY